MGDSGIGFESLSTGDCRLFRSSARNWPLRLLGLLQHYRHLTDVGVSRRAASRQKPPVAKLWTKPQHSSEKVKTLLPASDGRRAIAIEVLGYSNVGHLGSRHT